jgi:hypothetical protein
MLELRKGINMRDKPIPTRPMTEHEKMLREKFYIGITTQSDLLDKLSERLLTLELAIPSLYATVLKLVAGDKATLTVNAAFYVTFACWLLALALTLAALMPKKWVVDRNVLRQDPARMAKEGLGIEDFFDKSAQYKRALLIASSLLFFAGIFSAAFTL